MTSLGLLVLAVVYFGVPLALVIGLAIRTRVRTSSGSEVDFWVVTGIYLALLTLFAVVGHDDSVHGEGYGFLGYLFFTLPGSAVPSGFWLTVVSPLLAPAGLVDLSDPSASWLFTFGALCWAAVNPLALRWLLQRRNRARRALAQPQPIMTTTEDTLTR